MTLLCSENYFDMSYSELSQLSSNYQEAYYFPASCLHEKWYAYDGECPSIEFFLEIDDCESEKEKKKLFILERRKSSWNFSQELYKHLNRRILILANACLNYIQDSFDLQQKLIDCGMSIQPAPGRTNFFHPFITSVSKYGHMFNCYLAYSAIDFGIECIPENGGKTAIMSDGEVEFVWFLSKCGQERQINALTDCKGQKNFGPGLAIPDTIAEKTGILYFYDGCLYHGIKPEINK